MLVSPGALGLFERPSASEKLPELAAAAAALFELKNGKPYKELGKILRSCKTAFGTSSFVADVSIAADDDAALDDDSGRPSSSTRSILTGP